MGLTYPATKVFWIELTGQSEVALRRYISGTTKGWTCEEGYHTAVNVIGTAKTIRDEQNYSKGVEFEYPGHDDPRWPRTCDKCSYEFSDEDPWQEWNQSLYTRPDTGEMFTLREAPPGAMWDAFWYPDGWKNSDGRSLVVKCPNGREWVIDSRASNCTMPGDNVHKCWVRHGEPPEITVDKNGHTCQAGGGSILADDYHGFLQNGWLTAG